MSQIFHRSTNTISRVTIFGALFIVGGLLWLFAAVNRSPWMTQAHVAREQPIQFSHERHVAGNGIDCRYCHTSVEDSSFAGIPPTKTVHELPFGNLREQSVSRTGARELPDRARDPLDARARPAGLRVLQPQYSREQGRWLHDVPWPGRSHAAHVAGRIAADGVVLNCHRNPERFVRPRDTVFSVDYQAPANQQEVGKRLVAEYHIQKLTSCSTCHR
jgi:hypothetical protein